MVATVNANTTTGVVVTSDTSGALALQTGGTTALTISSAQAITMAGRTTNPTTISVGGATPSTSGAGITFPATQSASSDANTLDDYEEGTWTPSLGGTTTYTTQNGKYTKIGNVVTYALEINVILLGTGSNFIVSGLPFTCSSTFTGGGSAVYFNNIAVGVVSIFPRVDTGGTDILVASATAAAVLSGNNAIFANSARVMLVGSYYI